MDTMESKSGFPSIDMPWKKYYSNTVVDVPKCTLYQNIYDRNKKYTHDIAINYFGNRITYGKLIEYTELCAKTLRKIGIARGDCVTLCTAGVPEAIYIVLACSRIGAIANFINPLFTPEQMRDRINDTDAKWIIVLDAMYHYIKPALKKTCIQNIVILPVVNSFKPIISKVLYLRSDSKRILSNVDNSKQNYYSWKEFVGFGADYDGEIDRTYIPNTPVVMVYSSGTTGASKGILLTNDGILATNYCRNIPPDPVIRQKSFLQMIPIWFSTGIVISIMIPLINGSIVIPEPIFSKESFSKDLKKYKPNMTLTATSLWLHVTNEGTLNNLDLSRMECPISGGEKISGEDETKINGYFCEHKCKTPLFKGYGMCELGGTVTSTSATNGYVSKAGGAGYPLKNVIVSSFDLDTGKELRYGEHGEIRVCSPARMKEYFKNPEATADYFVTDNQGRVWGRTGDIGYVDEDGEVFILGRATDSYYSSQGGTVFLFDIEEVIIEDVCVNQCKVVDIIEDNETKLVAHIVFREGIGDMNDAITRISQHVSKSLPEYMRPDYYKIRKTMPVHSNGKRDIGALKSDRSELIKL